jgi:predicted O-methyltransferase YrrM
MEKKFIFIINMYQISKLFEKTILTVFSLKTFNIKRQKCENTLMNFSDFTYQNMCNILQSYINIKSKNYNILEIGCGEGKSTEYFIHFLNDKLIDFKYTANELLKKYEQNLNSLKIYERNFNELKKYQVIISSFEKITHQKFDILFLTAFSALNDNNIHKLYNLCHKDTLIVTITIHNKKILKYFQIIDNQNLRLIQKIYVLKIGNWR